MKANKNGETHPKRKVWLIVLLVFIGVCLAVVLAFYGYFHSKYSQIYNKGSDQTATGDYEDIVNPNSDLAASMDQAVKDLEQKDAVTATGDVIVDDDVFNVLLIGTDERTNGTFSENARGDVCMLLSVNTGGDKPTISLVSFERGMGVPILDGAYAGQWDWLTHTFRYGGADLLMREVSECFKIDVRYYARINFNFFIQAIDTLGGVTVNFDQAEAEHFRKAYGLETAVVGDNHLNGEMALAYARLRSIDSDWVRIQRQRETVLSAIEQCKNKSLGEINALLNDLLPMVQTNIPESKIAELTLQLPKIRKAEMQQMTIPAKGTYGGMTGMGGRSLFAVDFEANSQILKESLYPQYTGTKK